jgi:hypothetical protein
LAPPYRGLKGFFLVIFRSAHQILFRYDPSNTSHLILAGSIRVSTLDACRNAENVAARDLEEGTKITTSLPGTNYPNSRDLEQLFGVSPGGIEVIGQKAVMIEGENAVHREEKLENAFVFCTSTVENANSMKKRFGNGCLKIKDAVAFFNLVDRYLRQKVAPSKLSECVVDDVQYVFRKNNYRDHTEKPCGFIKPPGGDKTFEIEKEVRAIWIPQDFEIEPVVLRIPEIPLLLEFIL